MNTSREIAGVFLRLGLISFGGPLAQIALMREEIVSRRRWVTDEEFLGLVAASNLIPGPNATELALHLALRRGGWAGFFIGGATFVLPACALVGLLAVAYVRYGRSPQAAWLLYGIHPVVVGVILVALSQMARVVVKKPSSLAIAAIACALFLAGFNELMLLAAGGMVSLGAGTMNLARAATMVAAITAASIGLAAADLQPVQLTLTRLFLFFLRTGSVLFGSGYVLLAFLRADLVDGWHWLTDRQLLDAVAAGQITPGPLFSTATFIGFLLAGWPGAVLATIGIFGPAFFFVAVTAPVLPRLRASPAMSALLDGVVAASFGLMAGVSWHVARAALVDTTTVALCVGAVVALLALRVNAVWVIVLGALTGWLTAG